MESLLADLKLAARMLRRSPGFTITAVSALALGIGANTAIFSVVDAVLLRPLPYPHPERVVQLMLRGPQGNADIASVPVYNAWRTQDRVFDDVTAYDFGGPGLNLSGGDRPEQVKGIRVSREYFRLFGVPVARGRTFTAEEDLPRGPRVAVIGFGLWQRRFGSDPDLVGKTILLGGEPYSVVGILGADFVPDPAADIWLPFQADPNSTNNAFYFRGAARLKPGVTLDQARAALSIAAAGFIRRFPNSLGPNGSFTAEPMSETIVRNIRPTLYILLGAVGFVVLIACANVANLLLARAGGRAREIAIRAAIGAGRARIVRQLLTESLLLAAIGGVFGMALGAIGVRALLAVNPGSIPRIDTEGANVTMDWRILAFTLGVSLATGILFGLMPALGASRMDLNHMLKEGGTRTGGGRQNRTRGVLVVAEMALAIVLLAGAGLLIRTFMAIHSVAPGFDPHNVLTFATSLTGSRFERTAAIESTTRETAQRMEAIPGVEAVTVTASVPLENGLGLPFTIEGRPLTGGPFHGGGDWSYISYRYFEVFRIPLVQGRLFNARDDIAAPPVVLINQAMARKFWPKESAVGQRISIAKGPGVFNEPPREIVGVVADVHDDGLNRDPSPKMYVPLAQVKDAVMAMNNRFMPLWWGVRTSGDPYALSAAIQRELQTSADLPAWHVRSMERVLIVSSSTYRFNTLLLGIFAATAILLASIGLYGLMAYAVEQRKLEFGIRLALGAEPGNLRNMVMGQAMRLAALGIAIGLAGAYGLTRLMAGLLYGVKPRDPVVFGGVAAVLAVVALAASYWPARRAVRISPMSALRYE